MYLPDTDQWKLFVRNADSWIYERHIAWKIACMRLPMWSCVHMFSSLVLVCQILIEWNLHVLYFQIFSLINLTTTIDSSPKAQLSSPESVGKVSRSRHTSKDETRKKLDDNTKFETTLNDVFLSEVSTAAAKSEGTGTPDFDSPSNSDSEEEADGGCSIAWLLHCCNAKSQDNVGVCFIVDCLLHFCKSNNRLFI